MQRGWWQWFGYIIYWGFEPLPRGHQIPWGIISVNHSCSEVKQVTWSIDLRCVLLLDNQSLLDLCCNRGFMSRIKKASCALNMTSNGGGLRITKQGKFLWYKPWVRYREKAITNIIYIKTLIRIYRVTNDSKVRLTFIARCQQCGLPTCSLKRTCVVCTSANQRWWIRLDPSRW